MQVLVRDFKIVAGLQSHVAISHTGNSLLSNRLTKMLPCASNSSNIYIVQRGTVTNLKLCPNTKHYSSVFATSKHNLVFKEHAQNVPHCSEYIQWFSSLCSEEHVHDF